MFYRHLFEKFECFKHDSQVLVTTQLRQGLFEGVSYMRKCGSQNKELSWMKKTLICPGNFSSLKICVLSTPFWKVWMIQTWLASIGYVNPNYRNKSIFWTSLAYTIWTIYLSEKYFNLPRKFFIFKNLCSPDTFLKSSNDSNMTRKYWLWHNYIGYN